MADYLSEDLRILVIRNAQHKSRYRPTFRRAKDICPKERPDVAARRLAWLESQPGPRRRRRAW